MKTTQSLRPRSPLKTLLLGAFAAFGALAMNSAQAVQINPDGYGQVLLAPFYDVFDGVDNVVRVVNSSLTDAVKAKLILRSAVDSRECYSTILYLTPGDVAKLTLSPGPDPADRFAAVITSSDDSLLGRIEGNGQRVFASQSPLRAGTSVADLFRPATNLVNGRPNGDHCAIGSIEVVGAYAVRGLIHTPTGDVSVRNAMAKGDLYKIFSTDRATLNSLNPSNPPRSTIEPGTTDWGRIALLGSVDVTWKESTRAPRIRIPMTALASGVAPNYLLANEAFDVTVGAQTSIGQAWGVGGSETLPAIEDALNAHSMQGQYENDAMHATNLIVSYPTKYRHLVSKSPVDYTRPFNRPSPFHVDGSVEYGVTSFDLFELGIITYGCYESLCGDELSYYMIDSASYIFAGYFGQFFNAAEGWFSLDFIGPNSPVPTITYTHHIGNGDLATSFLQPMVRK